MTPEQWRKINEIVADALELPADARPQFLDEACKDIPQLREQIESLIVSSEEAGSTGILDRTSIAPLTQKPGAVADRVQIGRYRLLERLGEGGMGEVYLAERVGQGFEQKVALKLMRSGRSREDFLRRFLLERQTLAALQHPNIVRLLDGGTTETGEPYFVMDYVDGKPIDEYCSKHKLSVEDRLKLFLQAAAAVQYAHQNLVVHRDLKPNNILVTSEGTVRLLDFGIAKILTPEQMGETQVEARPMTPDYASPEQYSGAPVTTSSDIYSLGVMLYRLLTDQSPYAVTTNSLMDLFRAVCEDEFVKPSDKVVQTGGSSALSKRLQGDLDMILAMAMRKEPERRYASVAQFADDLRNHLDGRPVLAQPDTARYRIGKFLRRHKLAVAAAALLVLSLAGGLAASLWQSRIAIAERQRAEQAEQEAKKQRDRAEAETAEAKQQRERAEKRLKDVRQLANTMIVDVHDRIEDIPGATEARRYLTTKGVSYLEEAAKDAKDNVALQLDIARGWLRIGDVQGRVNTANVGDLKSAAASYGKARSTARETLLIDPENKDAKKALMLAHQRAAQVWIAMYLTSQAEPELKQALAIDEQLLRTSRSDPEFQMAHGQVHRTWGGYLRRIGRLRQAIQEAQIAVNTFAPLASKKSATAEAKQEYRGSLGLLSGLRDDVGESKLADKIADQIRDLQKAGASQSSVSGLRNQAASIRGTTVEDMQKSLFILEDLVAADASNFDAKRELGSINEAIGRRYQNEGKDELALAAFAKSYDIRKSLSALDPTNGNIRQQLFNMCLWMTDSDRRLGKKADEEKHLQEASTIRTALLRQDLGNLRLEMDLTKEIEKKVVGNPKAVVTAELVSIAIYQRLASRMPESIQPLIFQFDAYTRLAQGYEDLKEPDQWKEFSKRAIEIGRILTRRDPDDIGMAYRLATSLNEESRRAVAAKSPPEELKQAEDGLREGRTILERLLAKNQRMEFRRLMGITLRNLGAVNGLRGDTQQERDSLVEATGHFKQIADNAAGSATAQSEAATMFSRLLSATCRLGLKAEAKTSYETANGYLEKARKIAAGKVKYEEVENRINKAYEECK